MTDIIVIVSGSRLGALIKVPGVVSSIEAIEANTHSFRNISVEKLNEEWDKLMNEITVSQGEDFIKENSYRKKGKELKSWEKTKFYHR